MIYSIQYEMGANQCFIQRPRGLKSKAQTGELFSDFTVAIPGNSSCHRILDPDRASMLSKKKIGDSNKRDTLCWAKTKMSTSGAGTGLSRPTKVCYRHLLIMDSICKGQLKCFVVIIQQGELLKSIFYVFCY